MNAHVTINDLKLLDTEPRVQDLRLGEALGFAEPVDIRKLIRRNGDELQKHGGFFATMAKNGDPLGRGRPGEEYWLNEPQSILVCMFARTDRAAEIRREIIEVFMAWRRGHLSPAPGTPSEPFPFPLEGIPLQAYSLKLDTVRLCSRVHGTLAARAMWNALGLPPASGHEPIRSDEASRCLWHLLDQVTQVDEQGAPARRLRDWIEIALNNPDDGGLRDHLREQGIMPIDDGETAGFLLANSHPALAMKLAGTPWRETYPYVLRRLPGARVHKPMRFGHVQRRCTYIPADLLEPRAEPPAAPPAPTNVVPFKNG
jgi:hypothetical protein